MRILLADEELGIQKMLQDYLQSKSCEVISVRDGKEAFNMMANEQFDLIFLEKKMPRFDGIEVLHELNALEIRPRTVLLCGQGDDDYIKADVANYKHVTYMAKPFSLKEIGQVVDQVSEEKNNN